MSHKTDTLTLTRGSGVYVCVREHVWLFVYVLYALWQTLFHKKSAIGYFMKNSCEKNKKVKLMLEVSYYESVFVCVHIGFLNKFLMDLVNSKLRILNLCMTPFSSLKMCLTRFLYPFKISRSYLLPGVKLT